MFKKSLIFIALLSTLFFGACSDSQDSSSSDTSANDMISSNEYVLTALDKKQYIVKKQGNGFVLEGAEGKVVIFDIFATWCPPCRAVATHLSSLQKKYKDNVVIIGLTIEDKIENQKLLDFRAEYKADYVLVNSAENRRLSDAIVKELKPGERYPIPTMAMYLDGKLVNHYVGATEEEFIDSDIKRALGL